MKQCETRDDERRKMGEHNSERTRGSRTGTGKEGALELTKEEGKQGGKELL
jgi:hypothetical protein